MRAVTTTLHAPSRCRQKWQSNLMMNRLLCVKYGFFFFRGVRFTSRESCVAQRGELNWLTYSSTMVREWERVRAVQHMRWRDIKGRFSSSSSFSLSCAFYVATNVNFYELLKKLFLLEISFQSRHGSGNICKRRELKVNFFLLLHVKWEFFSPFRLTHEHENVIRIFRLLRFRSTFTMKA